ncbi:MAG: hypothetical protein IJ316_00345 [Clostridia bacterium]|nr:hypothetical protein [Clostridia bacterium]
MRKIYSNKLKEFFCKELIKTRANLGLTQFEISERLALSPRPYIELEHGRSLCSALTLVLYLIYLCPDVEKFLNQVRIIFESDKDDVA